MGSGSIGRGFRGDFRRWSLHPGKYIHRVVYPDQFSIRVKRGGKIESKVLSIFEVGRKSCLSSWNWSVPSSNAHYEALFPRAWTTIHEAVPGIRVTIHQMSPFLPHSYSEASMPACVFNVEVENLCDDDAEVSVMFTFQNGDNGVEDTAGGKKHHVFESVNDDSENAAGAAIKGICMSRYLHLFCCCEFLLL